MKIVVIGGTGLVGSQVARILGEQGHEIVAASPSSGVDALTGEGVDEAFVGADAVIDVSNSPSFEGDAAYEFFDPSTRTLLAAARAAGVGHFVALSVVGTGSLAASDYFRGKIRQEELITAGGAPFTIVHATQFFEFAGAMAAGGTVGDDVRVGPFLVQPIASADVAAAVSAVVLEAPLGGIVEIAGPDALPIGRFLQQALASIGDDRRVVVDADLGYFGAPVAERTLVPTGREAGGRPRLGPTTFTGWLEQHTLRV